MPLTGQALAFGSWRGKP